MSALYFEPTFEPERTMPPGKGMMTSRVAPMRRTAASAASSTVRALAPMMMRLPPPTAAFVIPIVASQTNSPSITGTRQ